MEKGIQPVFGLAYAMILTLELTWMVFIELQYAAPFSSPLVSVVAPKAKGIESTIPSQITSAPRMVCISINDRRTKF